MLFENDTRDAKNLVAAIALHLKKKSMERPYKGEGPIDWATLELDGTYLEQAGRVMQPFFDESLRSIAEWPKRQRSKYLGQPHAKLRIGHSDKLLESSDPKDFNESDFVNALQVTSGSGPLSMLLRRMVMSFIKQAYNSNVLREDILDTNAENIVIAAESSLWDAASEISDIILENELKYHDESYTLGWSRCQGPEDTLVSKL